MIHLLATGGTIAGEADPEAGHGRYRAGVRPVDGGVVVDAVDTVAGLSLSTTLLLGDVLSQRFNTREAIG